MAENDSKKSKDIYLGWKLLPSRGLNLHQEPYAWVTDSRLASELGGNEMSSDAASLSVIPDEVRKDITAKQPFQSAATPSSGKTPPPLCILEILRKVPDKLNV